MPRKPRLDVADTLYHVMGRGVARSDIFYTDRDRMDFVRRLARLHEAEDITIFAFVLMDNHFHLVLRRGAVSLGVFMRRLLTGYAVAFNLRHGRVGHLFQNRYKSIACEEEAYLLHLVRYVHLNPVRAGLVADPSQYRWSSHNAYLHHPPPVWLDVATVLAMFGGRHQYRKFVAAAMGPGSSCGIAEASAIDQNQLRPGGLILGSESFERRLMSRSAPLEMLPEPMSSVDLLPAIAAVVAARNGTRLGPGQPIVRSHRLSQARRDLIAEAVVRRGVRPGAVGRFLGISPAAVTRHLRALDECPGGKPSRRPIRAQVKK